MTEILKKRNMDYTSSYGWGGKKVQKRADGGGKKWEIARAIAKGE